MKINKILSIMLIINIISFNSLSALAIKDDKKAQKAKQSAIETAVQNLNLDWWKAYDDEYLIGYISKAIESNNDIKIATLRVEQARQNMKLQFANELPHMQVGVSPVVNKLPNDTGTDGSFSIPMIVSYEADIFLKNRNKTQSMKKLHEASIQQERALHIAIASQIGATYFNIVKLDKLISLQDEIIKDRNSIYKMTKLKNELGLASTADLTRAEKAYVLAVADLSDLKKAREIMLNSLAVLVGESPNNINDFKRASYDELVDLKVVPKEISSEVVTQRPDYIVSEKVLEKAGLDVRVAKKEFLPSINLFGLVSFNSFSNSSSFGWKNALALMGGSAMLDIFRGGAKIANLKLRKNYYEQMLHSYYKTNLTAIQEVNDALCALKFDNDKYNKNRDSYEMQDKEFKYSEIKYENGLISNLDLLHQKETLLSMNKLVVNSKVDCLINEISLYKAMGAKI